MLLSIKTYHDIDVTKKICCSCSLSYFFKFSLYLYVKESFNPLCNARFIVSSSSSSYNAFKELKTTQQIYFLHNCVVA